MSNTQTPPVGIIMGSDSDLPTMQDAIDILKDLGVSFEVSVVSAHRTPEWMVEYGKTAAERGIKVIIAGAGGAAHLPGMMASLTPLPVVGVPVNSHNSIRGIDSLLSIVQMPGGVPVATVGIDNSKNAGLLAARILGAHDLEVRKAVEGFAAAQVERVMKKKAKVEAEFSV